MQLVVLVPVIGLTLMADVIRAQPDGLARLKKHAAPLVATLGLTAVGLMAVAIDKNGVLGRYAGITNQHPGLGHAVPLVAETGVGLLAFSGFIPGIVCLALATQPRAWRDSTVGSLLIVTFVTSIVVTIEAGWFTAGQPLYWHIERYVAYAAPLLTVTAVMGVHRGYVDARRVAGATIAVGSACLLMPRLGSALEEQGYYSSTLRVQGLFSVGDQLGLSIFAGVCGSAATVALAASARRRWNPAIAVLAVAGIAMVVQSEAAWHWQIQFSRASLLGFPSDRAWLRDDIGAHRRIALLTTGNVSSQARITSFFSPQVPLVYHSTDMSSGIDFGLDCTWALHDSGAVTFSQACGPPPRTVLLDAPGERLTFRGQHVLADHGPFGRAVSLPASPQILAYAKLACPVPISRRSVGRGDITGLRRISGRGARRGRGGL